MVIRTNTFVFSLILLLSSSSLARAQWIEGGVTSAIARVNGTPGTDFQPLDTIRIDGEGYGSVPSNWGHSELIPFVAVIRNPIGDVKAAGGDFEFVAPGTSEYYESINEATYFVNNMAYDTTYIAEVYVYYVDMMAGAVILDTVTHVFTTD
ncbi:MAG: hypothetical protein ACKVP0_11815 [Pirellulaceae bacterium]